MANVEKLSIALTPDMAAEIRAAVEAGDYGSVSEVVRDALRGWRLRRRIDALETEELRRLVQEGIDSGPDLGAEAVFARLRAILHDAIASEEDRAPDLAQVIRRRFAPLGGVELEPHPPVPPAFDL